MKTIRIFFTFLLCLLLAACAKSARESVVFDLSGRDFDASVTFTVQGGEYAADYARRANSETLRFTAPERLRGVCAVLDRESGKVTVSLGEMHFVSEAFGEMFAFTKLFEPTLPLTAAESDNGTVTHTGGGVTVVTDGAGIPLSLCGNGFTVRVTAFSFAETAPDRKG